MAGALPAAAFAPSAAATTTLLPTGCPAVVRYQVKVRAETATLRLYRAVDAGRFERVSEARVSAGEHHLEFVDRTAHRRIVSFRATYELADGVEVTIAEGRRLDPFLHGGDEAAAPSTRAPCGTLPAAVGTVVVEHDTRHENTASHRRDLKSPPPTTPPEPARGASPVPRTSTTDHPA